MKIVKPNWVTHDGSPIFSVDIHPDGKRFATGGQGGDSGRVVIWNIEPVLNEAAENDPKVDKMLCQIDHHLACVNCVRWSSGGLLASAGDDRLIMVWKLIPGLGGTKILGKKMGVETWRCSATLRGHGGDILDLAWAPFNPWLASASVDNTIMIWDTNRSITVAILQGHTGLVKGLTWDPVGKYIASQSDDKTLRVWRTSDWEQETMITEPFEECGNTTHVLRLSWSPDGQYLVSAHAMNGGGPTAQIIERDGWKTDKDYVGHRKAVTCVKFNGNILQKKSSSSQKPVQFCCVAIGSRDRSLSFWSTCLKRPLVVINEVFVSSVLDISWSPCGMKLCACSKDGTTVFIEFSEEELGQPLDATQKLQIQERLYGKLRTGRCVIMEAPELFQKKKEAEAKKSMAEKKESLPSEPQTNSVKEKENSAQNTSVIQTVNTVSAPPEKAPTNKQIETRTSDGKRRITPMFIPLSSEINAEANKSVASTEPTSFSTSSQTKSTIVIEKRDEVVKPNISSNIGPKPSTSKVPDDPINQQNKSSSPFRSKTSTSNQKTQQNTTSTTSTAAPEKGRSGVLINPLKPSNNLCVQTGHFAASVVVDQELYHLEVYRGTNNEAIWDHYLGFPATGLAVTPSIIAVSLEDNTVHTFFTPRGGRATPPLAPPSPIARIHAAGSMLMVLSCYGDVRVWEITTHYCRIVVNTSAAHLLLPGVELYHYSLLNEGMPSLAFSNAKAYIFHKEMDTWLLVGDGQDPSMRWSSIGCTDAIYPDAKQPNGTLRKLQEGLQFLTGYYEPRNKMSHSVPCMINHMEQQVLASKALGSSEEYVLWLINLVNFMCNHEDVENRLRVILDELLGPSHSCANLTAKSVWNPVVLGVKKHKILEDVLKILSNHVRWQRLYSEYNDQLQELKNL